MRKTKKLRAMLSLITIGFLAGSGLAFADTDNYAENFESYGPGTVITNVPGWTATKETSVIVSTNYSSSYMGGDYPVEGDHTQVLQIDNGVTNTITPGTANITNWVDLVVKPVFSADEPTLPADAVAAAYFKTNGNLVVFHAPAWGTVAWLEIPLDVPVDESEWIRLTVAVNMADGDEFVDFARFYQIYINGNVVTNAAAYQLPSSVSASGGSWFASGASIIRIDPITNIVVQGTGYLDDLVVTNALTITPAVPAEASYIAALPTPGGLIYGQTLADAGLTGGSATNAAGGAVPGTFAFATPATVPPVGTNSHDVVFTPTDLGAYKSVTGQVSVVVVAAPSFIGTLPTVSQITEGQTLADTGLTGGTATNSAGANVPGTFDFDLAGTTVPPVGTNSYDVVFTPTDAVSYLPVTGAVDVVVVSATTATTNGTPYSWYDQFGLTPVTTYNDLDAIDSDGDGQLNWQEFLAGTRPDNSNSVFRVIGTITNGVGAVQLRWIGGTNGPVSPYVIESVTNLGIGPVMWVDMTNGQLRTEGTNSWTDSAASRKFYRVRATGD